MLKPSKRSPERGDARPPVATAGSRGSLLTLLAAAVCLVAALASPASSAAVQADPAEPAEPADAEETIWYSDDLGREYKIEEIPKLEGHWKWVGEGEERAHILGLTMDVVSHDDELFYVKSYRPPETEPARLRPELTDEERARVLATYDYELGEGDRIQFEPFDQGLPRSGQWRNGFTVADMNADGHADIVHGPPRKGGSWPVIFLGDGAGTWQVWREMAFPRQGYDYGDVAVADFNGDGHPDMALGIHLRGIRAFINDGNGSFREWSRGLDFQTPGRGETDSGFSSRAIEAVDWNRDGRIDLVAVGEGPRPTGKKQGLGEVLFTSHGPVVFLNQGNGSWTRHTRGNGPNEIFGDHVEVGDFDGDGRVDFATSSNMMSRKDLVNLAGEEVMWDTLTISAVRPHAYVRDLTAADFDGDGHDDLVISYMAFEAEGWRNGIDLLYSRPDAAWERKVVWNQEGRDTIYALDHGDLDGDGALDLVGFDINGDGRVFLGDGEGGFVAEVAPELAKPLGRCRAYTVLLEDLDGDGRDEVIASFADEASAYFDPDRCASGGGMAAWKVAAPAPQAQVAETRP